MQWPERVVHKLAPQRDQVGAALGEERFGLVRIDDHADRHGLDLGRGAHALGIGHLEARAPVGSGFQRLARVVGPEMRRAFYPAGRTVDHVDAALGQRAGEDD